MDIIEKIFNAGVVGAGGAGFPTHKKLVKDKEYLIINAAECEPLLQTDIYKCTNSALEIIKALDILKKEFNFKNVIIGIKGIHTNAIKALENAIDQENSTVEIFKLETIYPSGDEQILVYDIIKRVVPPGGIPLEVGTVVLNSTTVFTIYEAIKDIPVTSKIITVAGEVKNKIILNVPVGTTVKECIQAAGGTDLSEFVFIKGGPMMGKQFSSSDIEEVTITKADSGLIILPKNHYLSMFNKKPLHQVINQTKTSCIQCNFCTDLCSRYLIGHQIRPHKVMRSIGTGLNKENLNDALLCSECGICELYACPMNISPRQINIYVKKLLREEGNMEVDKNIYEDYIKLKDYRQIPQKRLVYRLNINKYDFPTDIYIDHEPTMVGIYLKHGIGREATPVVKVGDMVSKGDIIASIEIDDMGSNVHASISGKVTKVSDKIIIERV